MRYITAHVRDTRVLEFREVEADGPLEAAMENGEVVETHVIYDTSRVASDQILAENITDDWKGAVINKNVSEGKKTSLASVAQSLSGVDDDRQSHPGCYTTTGVPQTQNNSKQQATTNVTSPCASRSCNPHSSPVRRESVPLSGE